MVKMKHCCKNVVILMPEPVAEPALNGLRLNLRIVSIVMFNFASYLTIGLPLAVLPGYVHDVMGFSAFWAGLVISLQYFATLLSRPHAGRYADLLGPKKIVVFGLCGCFMSGLGYLTAGLTASLPVISLLLLCLGAKESGGAVQTLFRTPVTQVKVEIGCVKLAVHLRVEFEKHSSGCHT